MNTQVLRSSRGEGERLTSVPFQRLRSHRHSRADVQIVVDASMKYQQVRGFGGAITEAAGYTLARLPEAARSEVVSAYFDGEAGNHYTMTRLHINSCDFALENYDYVAEGDRSLSSFDISREERWVLPVVREARAAAGGALFTLASPWSPPGWMKTNGQMNGGGTLLPEFRTTWAAYLVAYLQRMRSLGIDVSGLSAQNEPAAMQTWDSCVYSASEEREFVKNHLGPGLRENELGEVKLLIWDHNRDIIVERVRDVLSDPEAARFVWGVGHHWYQGEEFEHLSAIHDMFPDTHLIFTEGCQEGGVHLGAWFTGERYGRNIIGDMRNWVEGWIDWNIVLDETGGPNHVGNYCDAPIIADTRSGELHYNSSYWYIGHFSRFVPPGSTRIASSFLGTIPAQLSHVAFAIPDGSIVTVVMNESDGDHTVTITPNQGGGDRGSGNTGDGAPPGLSVEIPAHGIITAIIGAP